MRPQTPLLKIIVADYPSILRAGVVSLLSAQPDMEVLSDEGTPEGCLESLRSLRQRVGVLLIVGLGLPGTHAALGLIRSVRERFPTVTILACSLSPDDQMVSHSLFAGADGFVSKDVESADFVDAVRRAASGEIVLAGVPDTWVGRIADHMERTASTVPVLTDREAQVLTVAGEGLTSRQIGTRLGVTERTVTTHLGHIYQKLGASGRVSALSTYSAGIR
jgi:two-component system, NarL family, response regulator DevR